MSLLKTRHLNQCEKYRMSGPCDGCAYVEYTEGKEIQVEDKSCDPILVCVPQKYKMLLGINYAELGCRCYFHSNI